MESNLNRLRHIVAIARTGSFSLAAKEEGISQPALTRSVQAFEAQHGVRLFDRGRGGAQITSAGTFVVDQARSLLEAARDLDRSLHLFAKGEAGRVSVGFGPMLGSLLVPKLSKAFLRDRPNLQIFTFTSTPAELLEKLLDDSIEMIVCNSQPLEGVLDVEQEILAGLDLSFVVRAGHPATKLEKVRMADLAAWPVATAVELAQPGLATSGGVISENYHILREVTAETDCVWLANPGFVAKEIRDGRLALLDVAELSHFQQRISIASRRGRTRSKVAQIVAEHIRCLLTELQSPGPCGNGRPEVASS